MKSFKKCLRRWRLAALTALCLLCGVALPAMDPMLTGNWVGQADGVAVSGQYAYVVGKTNGLQILDVSHPTTPIRLGGWTTNLGAASSVAVSGRYVCVASPNTGLTVLDVNNPAAPTRLGGYLGSGANRLIAQGVALSPDARYAYVAANKAGLVVFDLNNPANIVRLSSALVTNADGIANFAYGVTVSGNHAYVAYGLSGLQVFNISNPASPQLVGSYNPGIQALGVTVAGGYAYVAAADAGVLIVDVSNPANPTLVSSLATGGQAKAVALSTNHIACVAGTGGLQMVEVADPAHPAAIGTWSDAQTASGVAVSGLFAYLADGNVAGTNGGLVVLAVPQWNPSFGWLYDHGNGWYGSHLFGWLSLSGNWGWSSYLQGSLGADGVSRTLWSPQFRWLTPSASDDGTAFTSTLGWIVIGDFAGWVWNSRLGWIWAAGDGTWFWSSHLQGSLGADGVSHTYWSPQFRWLTPSESDPYQANTTAIGPIYIGQYHGTAITDGWVVSDRFGYVWAAGDGVWFYSDTYGWLGVTESGGIWCVNQNRFL